MTAAEVVDASALGAIAFGEAEAASVLGTLAEAELVAPRLLLFELGNNAWKKVTREPGKSGLSGARTRLSRASPPARPDGADDGLLPCSASSIPVPVPASFGVVRVEDASART